MEYYSSLGLRGLQSRVALFTLLYSFMNALSATTLYLLGEVRVDVYVSLNILAYYISYAILRPPTSSLRVRVLNRALIALFIVIAGYRVYEVLTH
jgi:hypothetical protein